MNEVMHDAVCPSIPSSIHMISRLQSLTNVSLSLSLSCLSPNLTMSLVKPTRWTRIFCQMLLILITFQSVFIHTSPFTRIPAHPYLILSRPQRIPARHAEALGHAQEELIRTPDLVRLGLGRHPTLKLYICLHPDCQHAVGSLERHLRKFHPQTVSVVGTEFERILARLPEETGPSFLPDFHHFRPAPSLPYLNTVLGVVCRHCHFATPLTPGTTAINQARAATRHLKFAHPTLTHQSWQEQYTSPPQPLQTFFHPQFRSQFRYFPVNPPLPPDWEGPFLTSDFEDDTNFAAFRAFTETPIPYQPEDDLHNIHPVLRQYPFHHYLRTFDRALIREIASSSLTQGDPPGYRLVSRLLKATFRHIYLLSFDTDTNPGATRPNMQWIWSFAPDASVFAEGEPERAFMEHIHLQTLLDNYVPTVARLLLVGLRHHRLKMDVTAAGVAALALLPPFPLNPTLSSALLEVEIMLSDRSRLPPQEQDIVDDDAMGALIDALAGLLHHAPTGSISDCPNPTLAFRFMAMIGAKADGSFAPCSDLTSPTTHLVTATRSLVLWLAVHRPPPSDEDFASHSDALLYSIRHHRRHIVLDGKSSPFVFLHSFFNIASVLAKDEESFTPHVWTDGSAQQRFTAHGRPFNIQQMAHVLRTEADAVRVMYTNEILRGLPFQTFSLSGLVDNPTSLVPGYSFATDPVNDLQQHSDRAVRFFESEPERNILHR